jgi:hypothetical protein
MESYKKKYISLIGDDEDDATEKTPKIPKIQKSLKAPKKKKLEIAIGTPAPVFVEETERDHFHGGGCDQTYDLPFSFKGFIFISIIHFILYTYSLSALVSDEDIRVGGIIVFFFIIYFYYGF